MEIHSILLVLIIAIVLVFGVYLGYTYTKVYTNPHPTTINASNTTSQMSKAFKDHSLAEFEQLGCLPLNSNYSMIICGQIYSYNSISNVSMLTGKR